MRRIKRTTPRDSAIKFRKIINNFGAGAWHVLGPRGYLHYAATAALVLPSILKAGNLRPVDMAMTGVIELRHPLNGRLVRIDLDAYRPGDDAEGTYAFGLVREIWMRDIYLSHFDLPDTLGCVIDLGANRGIFSLQAAAVAERVIAVEPLQAYSTPLARNLAINSLDNVVLVNAMVGGKALLEGGGLPVIALSEVMAMAQGMPVDLVKIDIEGSEFGLDLECLRRVKRLAMEMHPQWGSALELVEQVRNLGFDCHTYDESLAPVSAGHADFLLAINNNQPDARWAA